MLGATLLLAAMAAAPGAAQAGGRDRDPLAGIKHIVVIYEENHSFDNLWGLWPGVDGIARRPSRTPRQTQVDVNGRPFDCLLQVDVNLTTSADPPPNGGLAPTCSTNPPAAFNSAFPNRIFDIGRFIPPDATTCYKATPTAPFGPPTACPTAAASPAAAPVTWCTASTRSSTRSTTAAWTATRSAATRSA
jgi:phospholipase C